MPRGSGAVWELPAAPSAVAQLRRHAVALATELGMAQDTVDDVALGVSEAVTNVVEHAYAGIEPGYVRMRCRADGDRLIVEIADEGPGVAARTDSPGLGHGIAAIGAVAQSLEVTT